MPCYIIYHAVFLSQSLTNFHLSFFYSKLMHIHIYIDVRMITFKWRSTTCGTVRQNRHASASLHRSQIKTKTSIYSMCEKEWTWGCYFLRTSEGHLGFHVFMPLPPIPPMKSQGSTLPLCKSRTGRIKRPGPRKRKRPVKSFPEARGMLSHVELIKCPSFSNVRGGQFTASASPDNQALLP